MPSVLYCLNTGSGSANLNRNEAPLLLASAGTAKLTMKRFAVQRQALNSIGKNPSANWCAESGEPNETLLARRGGVDAVATDEAVGVWVTAGGSAGGTGGFGL